MDNKAEFILALTTLVVKHGIPAALKIVQTFEVEDPPLEDIERLKQSVPPPDSYFGG